MFCDPLVPECFQSHPLPSEKYSTLDISTKVRLINDHKDGLGKFLRLLGLLTSQTLGASVAIRMDRLLRCYLQQDRHKGAEMVIYPVFDCGSVN